MGKNTIKFEKGKERMNSSFLVSTDGRLLKLNKQSKSMDFIGKLFSFKLLYKLLRYIPGG